LISRNINGRFEENNLINVLRHNQGEIYEGTENAEKVKYIRIERTH